MKKLFLFIVSVLSFSCTSNEELAEKYFYMGLKFDNSKNYDQAILYYSKSLEYYPERISTLFNRGSIYMLTDNYANAKKDMFSILNQDEYNYEAGFVLAQCYYYENNYDSALFFINKLILKYPDSTLLYEEKKLYESNK